MIAGGMHVIRSEAMRNHDHGKQSLWQVVCVCVREGLTTYEIVMFDRSLALHERLAYL
jgi:hypothetical protein